MVQWWPAKLVYGAPPELAMRCRSRDQSSASVIRRPGEMIPISMLLRHLISLRH